MFFSLYFAFGVCVLAMLLYLLKGGPFEGLQLVQGQRLPSLLLGGMGEPQVYRSEGARLIPPVLLESNAHS